MHGGRTNLLLCKSISLTSLRTKDNIIEKKEGIREREKERERGEERKREREAQNDAKKGKLE